jgi:4-hydroxybenzoate polyprenyltransferase
MNTLQRKNIPHYLKLMRVDRPIGTYLVAWPAVWGLWVAAQGMPDMILLVVFLLGAFLMRSAGCVINDFADRNIDGKVTRTQQRPLAQKQILAGEALQLFIVLCLCAACLLLLTNKLTALWSLGAVAITFVYPFMKRFTHLPQVVLGMAFSWAVPMAFAAQSNQIPTLCWQLYWAVVLWVIVYDTFYAMVDRPDDLKIGVKSTAILFGSCDRLITAFLQCVFVLLMANIGYSLGRGLLYFLGLGAAAILFIYQQWLIRDRQGEHCFRAFLNNHYVGVAVFAGLASDYAYNPVLVTD